MRWNCFRHRKQAKPAAWLASSRFIEVKNCTGHEIVILAVDFVRGSTTLDAKVSRLSNAGFSLETRWPATKPSLLPGESIHVKVNADTAYTSDRILAVVTRLQDVKGAEFIFLHLACRSKPM